MITSSGGFESGDAITRYETAKSFLAGQWGVLPAGESLNSTVEGRNGKIYATYGPMQSLLMLPLIASANLLPIPEEAKDRLIRTVFNLAFIPVVSAVVLVVLYYALTLIGFPHAVSSFTVIAIGLGTPYWHYARSAQEENMVALGFVCWLLGVALFNAGRNGGLLLASCGACFALGTRWAVAAPIIPLVVGSFLFLRKRFRESNKVEVLLSVLLCIGVVFALFGYNQYRFGSPWETGYGLLYHPLFAVAQSPQRALALLFSPYRGLFFYAPILVLVVAGVIAMRTRFDAFNLIGLAAFIAAFVLNACYSVWTAGYSWGPRFLIAPIVLLAPLIASLYTQYARKFWWKPILVFSVVIQVFSVVLPSATEDLIRKRAHVDDLVMANDWHCEYSAACLRPPLVWEAIKNTFSGNHGLVLNADSYDEQNQLESSDYRTLFWWPFRFSFRFHFFNRFVAASITSIFAGIGALFLIGARRAAASPPVIVRMS